MTIDQLRYVCAVVEYGSFSEASVAMHITQSALSKQVAKLEKELNVTLFNRSHRSVTLTAAGNIFYEDAVKILEQHRSMMTHMQEYKQHEASTIEIAMLPIVAQYDLAKKLRQFSHQYPNIKLRLIELEERDFMEQDIWSSYDCYILRDYHASLPEFHHILLYQDILAAIVSRQHPLSRKDTLTMEDLKEEKLLLPPTYTSMSRIAMQALQQVDMTENIIHRGRLETLLSMAAENSGIALAMKKSLTPFQQDRIKIIPLDPPILGDIRFYYHKHHKKKESIQQLLQALK